MQINRRVSSKPDLRVGSMGGTGPDYLSIHSNVTNHFESIFTEKESTDKGRRYTAGRAQISTHAS